MNDSIQRQIDALDAGGLWAKLSREFYASGTWTPALGGSSSDGTVGYDNRNGFSIRIGGLVVAGFSVDVASVAVAPGGDLRLGNLPFTSSASAGYGFLSFDTLNLSANVVQVQIRVRASSTSCDFIELYDNAGATLVQGAAISASTVINGMVIYEAAG
jgi:hypothetical protein